MPYPCRHNPAALRHHHIHALHNPAPSSGELLRSRLIGRSMMSLDTPGMLWRRSLIPRITSSPIASTRHFYPVLTPLIYPDHPPIFLPRTASISLSPSLTPMIGTKTESSAVIIKSLAYNSEHIDFENLHYLIRHPCL